MFDFPKNYEAMWQLLTKYVHAHRDFLPQILQKMTEIERDEWDRAFHARIKHMMQTQSKKYCRDFMIDGGYPDRSVDSYLMQIELELQREKEAAS